MRTWRVWYHDLDTRESFQVEVEAYSAREAVYRVKRDNQFRVAVYLIKCIGEGV